MGRHLYAVGTAIAIGLGGVVGVPPVQGARSRVEATVFSLTPAPLETRPGSFSQSALPTYPRLQPGSTGMSVLKLQQSLAQLGYYSGPLDGFYGPATTQAVTHFQNQHQQPTSGTVKEETWRALLRALNPQTQLAQLSLLLAQSPTFSPLTPNAPPPPPSRIWLLVMPLLPLLGGALTYLNRRLRSKEPFAHVEHKSSPPS